MEIITKKSLLPSLKDLATLSIETESFTSNEKNILDNLEELVKDLEIKPVIMRGDFGLVIIFEGIEGKKAPLYLFDGHVDTVSVKDEERGQWLTDPFKAAFKEEEGVEYVYGKGAVDQQGGYLVAFKALVETLGRIPMSERAVSVGMVFTRGEEVAEGFSSEKIALELEKEGYNNLKGVVITEPSNSEIMIGQMGRLRLKVVDHDKNPFLLARLIGSLNSYKRVAKVTGEKQALTLIGADLKSDYTGTIDSQVPDRAFLSFEKNDLDLELFKASLSALKEKGKLIDYTLVEEGALIKLSLTGKTAHSAFPRKGVSAGLALAELLFEIEDLLSGVEISTLHIGDGELTGNNEGGVLYYDYRIDVDESPESLIESLKLHAADLLKEMPNLEIAVSDQNISLDDKEYAVHQYFPAWNLEAESVFLDALKNASREHSKIEDVSSGAWGFCTNGSGWTKKPGLELIGIGPGDPTLSHQPNERCSIAEMEFVCSVLQRFISSLVRK